MFAYDTKLLADFPNTVGGVIYAQQMKNSASSQVFLEDYQQVQESVKERIGETPLSELPTLSAWRSTFSTFGVNPTKYRSAPEALLRRLTKKGDIPSINTLVDIGNLVSIRYGIPVAVFDVRELGGAITVRYADGTERYTEFGSDAVKHPETGEVIFVDNEGLVFARRWCWKQSLQSAANETTTEALIVTEAQHSGGLQDIENALTDLLQLIQEYAGGKLQSTILNKDHARATF